jgi:hypothetical protein
MPACEPASILHGQSVFVPIRLLYGEQTPPERFYAVVPPYMADARTTVTTTPPTDVAWAPWGSGAGFTFTSTQVDPPERVETWPVWVALQNRSITRLLTCIVTVQHLAATPSPPPVTHPTVKVDPPVATRGGGLTMIILNLTGAGFTPNGNVSQTLIRPDGGHASFSVLQADGGGNVSATLAIPPDSPVGEWTVVLHDDSTGVPANTAFTLK